MLPEIIINLFIKHHSNLAAFTFIHDSVRIGGPVKCETVSDEVFRMDFPPDEPLEKFFHQRDAGYPRAVDGLLFVDDVRTRVELERTSFPTMAILPHLRVALIAS